MDDTELEKKIIIQLYRDKAEECRMMAMDYHDFACRNAMFGTAKIWEDMATQIERGIVPLHKPLIQPRRKFYGYF